jgi:hypothetical protein
MVGNSSRQLLQDGGDRREMWRRLFGPCGPQFAESNARKPMTHSSFWSTRAAVAVMLLALADCKNASRSSSDNQVASLLFDVSSPAAREALSTPVDFRLTDANYAQWEQAQRFLDALPRSAFSAAPSASGNPIDNAVATLESSPRARTAIERTGLTVKDFVLETIALAQATEAETDKPAGGVSVSAENVQVIQRYRSRILQARAEARATSVPTNTYRDADTTSIGAQTSSDIAPVDQGADVRMSDSARTGERGRDSDSVRRAGQADEAMRRPPADTVRDTIPNGDHARPAD